MQRMIYCVLAICLLVSGCASPSSPDNLTYPSSAQNPENTVAPSATTPPTPTPTPSPTPTATPTEVPTVTSSPTVTPTPTPTTPVCVNQAELVRHLSVSDNTKMLPNVYFAKVWRIKNIGTCTWTPEYSIVFDSGDDFGSIHESVLNREVKPGETVDVQVALRTPMEPKTYSGGWLLRDQYGNMFGTGELGKQPISALVIVIPFKVNERKETLSCG